MVKCPDCDGELTATPGGKVYFCPDCKRQFQASQVGDEEDKTNIFGMLENLGDSIPNEYFILIMFGLIGETLLAATEFYPLRKDEGYLEKYMSPMKELYQEASKIPDPMENPFDWIKEFSSGFGFFLGSTEEHLPEIEDVFRRYLELWIGYVKKAKPIVDKSLSESASVFKKKFRKLFHENDPGQDNLYRNFGKDWTEKYYSEVLY